MKTSTFRFLSLVVFAGLANVTLVPNTQARIFVTTNSTWRFFKGTTEASNPTNAWREVNFDDSAWLMGTAPFHFGTNSVGGDDNQTGGTILTEMRSNYTCLFLRQTFVIENTNTVAGLWLNFFYDDGLAVWLNGQSPRAPVNANPNALAFTNTATTAAREAGFLQRISIPTAVALLRTGTNVLCVQALNGHLNDEDFRIDLELTETPSAVQFAAASHSVVEDAGLVEVRVLRAGALDGAFTVDYATANGTAMAGLDYAATNGTLNFAAGEVEKVIRVPILNGGLQESSEAFQLKLSNPVGASLGNPSTATVSIADNDLGFQVEFANYWITEGAGPVVIGVMRGNDGDFPVTVDFATADSMAVAGQDYVPMYGTLTFAAGERLKLVSITILNDGVQEMEELFTVTLSNPGSGTILGSKRVAGITIHDNDPGIQFTFNQHWIHEHEGQVDLAVLRGNDLRTNAFTVDFTTSNGTALAGIDYTAVSGTLQFAEGEMSKVISVPVLNDQVEEMDEKFYVILSNPTGGLSLGDPTNATAVVTVCDSTGMIPHRIASVQMRAGVGAVLTLEGGVSKRFQPFFDIYPVEVSDNLKAWQPHVLLTRTNSVTNALVFADTNAGQFTQRFYRVPARHQIAYYLPPTGPYAVGRVDRLLNDTSRRNRYGDSTNGSFMVSVWYPATRRAGDTPVPWDGEFSREPYLWTSAWLDRIRLLSAYASQGAELVADPHSFPVVLCSHGMTGFRQMHFLADQLASYGYIVVGMDHFDAYDEVRPDGTRYNYTGKHLDTLGVTLVGIQDRVHDLAFVMDQLEQWNQEAAMFAGRLDLSKVGAIGFSWGGPTVGEWCRTDARCLAVVSLDYGTGGVTVPLELVGLQKPSLSMQNNANTDKVLFQKAMTNTYWFQISDTIHQDLFGSAFLPDASRNQPQQEVGRTLRAYMVSFFDKHLKGQDDHLLDGPPGNRFPRVINFQIK